MALGSSIFLSSCAWSRPQSGFERASPHDEVLYALGSIAEDGISLNPIHTGGSLLSWAFRIVVSPGVWVRNIFASESIWPEPFDGEGHRAMVEFNRTALQKSQQPSKPSESPKK